MKYIDLENGIFTHPETGKRFSIEIDTNPDYYLSFTGLANRIPFKLLNVDRLEYCRMHGVEPLGGDWPETKSRDELITIINFLNEDLSRKFETKKSEVKQEYKEQKYKDLPWLKQLN